MSQATVLYAPSVHTGGGLVLLRGLLAAWPAGGRRVALLDQRARDRLELPPDIEVNWVRPTLASRWAAERRLASAESGATVLCFHGLPPLLPNRGRVSVFQQNRIHLGLIPLSQYAPRTALRLACERTVARLFRHRVAEYIVQTPSMARALTRWHGGQPAVRIVPFADAIVAPQRAPPEWDFVYVADGEAHKNHRRLLQAWALLAEQGLRPRLALTLGPRDAALAGELPALRQRCGAEVHNLGQLGHDQALALLASSRALIFPSLGESFGLPLIEAQQLGLPIVAAELDYVRDVCTPVQSFDALSPVSIARAVRRFLDQPEPVLDLQRPRALWAALGLASDGE